MNQSTEPSVNRGSKVLLAMLLMTIPTACSAQASRNHASSGAAAAQEVAPSTAETVRSAETRSAETVRSLVQLGPRVAGTPAAQKASQFLIDEYRKAGYQTKIQTFTYSKFADSGSSITISGKTLPGLALSGSIAGKPAAKFVTVPNVGTPADFASVNVKGAIALVRRGEIPFAQKAQNATEAGAIALIIVNTESGEFRGTLGQSLPIPVLGLSGAVGNPLLDRVRQSSLTGSLNVNTQQRTVTGRNVIAHLPGVEQPRLLLGGHYDSVSGSPGANDNASGTAVVLETARQLVNTPLARQIWFVAFDGEEDGLHGSRSFVNQANPAFLTKLTAMLNFDMVGVNDRLRISGSPGLLAVKGVSSENLFANSSSDHASFAAKKVPVLFFYRGQDPNYHTPNDKVIDPKLLDQTTQSALEKVTQLLSKK